MWLLDSAMTMHALFILLALCAGTASAAVVTVNLTVDVLRFDTPDTPPVMLQRTFVD